MLSTIYEEDEYSRANYVWDNYHKLDENIVNQVFYYNNRDDLELQIYINENEIKDYIKTINGMYLLNGHTIYIRYDVNPNYITIQKEYNKLLYLHLKHNGLNKYKFYVSIHGFKAYLYVLKGLERINHVYTTTDTYSLYDYNFPIYVNNKYNDEYSVCFIPIYIRKYFNFIKYDNVKVKTSDLGILNIPYY